MKGAGYKSPVARSVPFDNSNVNLVSTNVQDAIEEIFAPASALDAARVAYEDFMFDAYAGNGGNDNQYAFTAIANGGTSDIDGAVSVQGDDYEGIHILSSSTSATARPLVSAFNNVNRMALGHQEVYFEYRVRIETLATTAQKFTCRYGLMNDFLIGMPANGVLFSYDPIYPVTPVAQVVTVTPVVTSQAPTQVFTETLNGTNYTYTYTTPKVVTVTPNSFPNATYQVNSVAKWTRTNNTLYTITINGFACNYTSDANATDAEIAAGLVAAINANSNVNTAVVATGSAKPFTVTSLVLGQAFTITGSANITSITTTTANVPIAVYTQTINGTNYVYTSDGTPTATEVVTGLKNLINADGPLPVTATGTTTLILTGDVSGDDFTYSGTANLTQTDSTVSTTATNVVTQLKNLINADGPLPIDATGTTTLILTANPPGFAFTYSGTSNLTQVLTTANVTEVLYSGNWKVTAVSGSTATTTDTGVPVVAGQWYKLRAVISASGNLVTFKVDHTNTTTITTNIPTGISKAVRFVFKLEKTVGTTARTTSIDYISWGRTR